MRRQLPARDRGGAVLTDGLVLALRSTTVGQVPSSNRFEAAEPVAIVNNNKITMDTAARARFRARGWDAARNNVIRQQRHLNDRYNDNMAPRRSDAAVEA